MALHPWAPSNAWPVAPGQTPLSKRQRKALNRKGQQAAAKTERLLRRVAKLEDEGVPLGFVGLEDLPNSIANIVGACMARAVEHSGVACLAACAMGNHTHTTIRDNEGRADEFLEYFNGQTAASVNRFLGRKHQLWARRAAVEPIIDDEAEIERTVYTLTNPQAAGLVNRLEDWPGLSSAEYYLTGNDPRFLTFDTTRWRGKGRPKDIGPFLSTVTLRHGRHAALRHLSREEERTEILRRVRARESELREQRARSGKRCLGHAGLAVVVPGDGPKSAGATTPAPRCHTTQPALRTAYAQAYRIFEHKCRSLILLYMGGDLGVQLPEGAQVPGRRPRPRSAPGPGPDHRLSLRRESIAAHAVW